MSRRRQGFNLCNGTHLEERDILLHKSDAQVIRLQLKSDFVIAQSSAIKIALRLSKSLGRGRKTAITWQILKNNVASEISNGECAYNPAHMVEESAGYPSICSCQSATLTLTPWGRSGAMFPDLEGGPRNTGAL